MGVSVIGIELIVASIDRSIELFVNVMGCTLISRSPSTLIVGEVAVIDAGAIMISLLEPASSGQGALLAERAPRLSQLIFAPDDDDDGTAVRTAFEQAIAAGLAISDLRDGRFHITPESGTGALGQPVAIVTVSNVGQ